MAYITAQEIDAANDTREWPKEQQQREFDELMAVLPKSSMLVKILGLSLADGYPDALAFCLQGIAVGIRIAERRQQIGMLQKMFEDPKPKKKRAKVKPQPGS